MHLLKTAPFRHEITPSSEHGIAHPVKTWPSSLVSRFPHFLKTRFTRFPHFSGYRAALFRPRDCIKRRFRRFYRLTVKRRAATRPACGMEVRLIPRRPSAASRQCPHLGDAGLWRACRSHPWSQWSARPILRQTPATYEHILGNDCSALAIRFIQIPIYSGLPNAHHHRNLTDRTITRQRHGVSER